MHVCIEVNGRRCICVRLAVHAHFHIYRIGNGEESWRTRASASLDFVLRGTETYIFCTLPLSSLYRCSYFLTHSRFNPPVTHSPSVKTPINLPPAQKSSNRQIDRLPFFYWRFVVLRHLSLSTISPWLY